LSNKEIKWECTNCHSWIAFDYDEVNKVRGERKLLFKCLNPKCGALNLVDHPRVKDALNSGNFICECIPFTGGEAKLPTGTHIYNDGTVVYITADGEKLTREKYVETYAIDPKITLQKMWEGRIKPPTLSVNPGYVRPDIKVLGKYTHGK